MIHCGKSRANLDNLPTKISRSSGEKCSPWYRNMSILEDFEKRELEHPTSRKIDGDRIIYESRNLNNTTNPGRPVLTDFGEAQLRERTHTGLIQPIQYRAPEVLLRMPWDYKVDIWNIGVMVSFAAISASGVVSSTNILRYGTCSKARICSKSETLRMSYRWSII
jgi:serine/threonine protein kinase